MLTLKNISVGYGKAIILEKLSLSVEKGLCYAVLGPNGAGKSTLLKSITGSLKLNEGMILYNNIEISKLPTYKISRLGIALAPEARRLFPDMTVKENLEIATYFRKKAAKEKGENYRFVYDIFPRLKDRENQKAGTMSGGEQQMLAIGRALMNSPDLLLLDEPSMGLAHIIKEQIFDGIEKIKKNGKTILIVEQDASMIMPIADKISILEHGKITWTGNSAEIENNNSLKSSYLGI